MKTKIKRLILVLVLGLFSGTTGFTQNIFQGEPSDEIKEIAKETTEMWNRELSLTAKQAGLMEDKVIEYEIKREELFNSKMNEEAKKERFLILQELEERDMRNILTQPQFEKYMNLKGDPGFEGLPDDNRNRKTEGGN